MKVKKDKVCYEEEVVEISKKELTSVIAEATAKVVDKTGLPVVEVGLLQAVITKEIMKIIFNKPEENKKEEEDK